MIDSIAEIRAGCLLIAILLLPLAPLPMQGQSETLEPAFHITEFGGDEGKSFAEIVDAAIGPASEIYVLERRGGGVAVYDSTGRFLHLIRTSSGESSRGEPDRLQVSDSLLIVSYGRASRAEVYTLDGRAVRTVTLPNPGEVPAGPGEISLLEDGRAVAVLELVVTQRDETSRLAEHIVVVDGRNGVADTLFTFQPGAIPFRSESTWGALRFDLPEGRYDVSGDSLVVVADCVAGRIRWYRSVPSGLEEVGEHRLQIQSPSVTSAEIDRQVAQLPDMGPGLQTYPPEFRPALRQLVAGSSAVWYVVENAPDGPDEYFTEWTRLPHGGDSPIEYRTPYPVQVLDADGSTVVASGASERDGAFLVIFRVD